MFPVTDSSQTIIDCLLKEVNRYGVHIRMNTEVKELHKTEDSWEIKTATDSLKADYVCVASGGYPKSAMFQWLQQSGHSIEEPVPSLFTFNIPKHPITQLMGVSVPNARVKIAGTKLEEEGPLLITHWGLSGPAILKLSAWGARELSSKNYEYKITVNWLPPLNEQQLTEQFRSYRFDLAAQKISNKNPFGFPQRLWDFFLDHSGIDKEKRWADLPAKDQNRLVKNLCNGEFDIKGKTTFKEEFVTAGGIKLNEVDTATMQSKLVPGLYFAGEVLNVDGVTGGFNFQHAWTSGFIAGKSIAGI
jgi:predicted Rossmann fold flavoprotein